MLVAKYLKNKTCRVLNGTEEITSKTTTQNNSKAKTPKNLEKKYSLLYVATGSTKGFPPADTQIHGISTIKAAKGRAELAELKSSAQQSSSAGRAGWRPSRAAEAPCDPQRHTTSAPATRAAASPHGSICQRPPRKSVSWKREPPTRASFPAPRLSEQDERWTGTRASSHGIRQLLSGSSVSCAPQRVHGLAVITLISRSWVTSLPPRKQAATAIKIHSLYYNAAESPLISSKRKYCKYSCVRVFAF